MPTISYYKRTYGNNCWMRYRLSRDNRYTLHHIRKRQDNGTRKKDNLALLTTHAHRDFNKIEMFLPTYAKKLNELFRELNNSNRPPTLDYWIELNNLLREINEIMRLSGYCNLKQYSFQRQDDDYYYDEMGYVIIGQGRSY